MKSSRRQMCICLMLPPNDIGKAFLQARLEHNLTLSDASAALHIRTHYLEALEADEFDKLPKFPYSKAYLIRYATYLSLDAAELARRFDQIQANKPRYFLPHHFSHHKQVTTHMAWGSAIAGLMLLMVWMLWVRPDVAAPSIVDKAPELHITTIKLPESNCFMSSIHYYPPCYWSARSAEKSMIFQLKSIGDR